MTGDYILSTEIDGNITQVLVHLTLEECEFYSFKVRAFSLEGYGKLSEAVTMETVCRGKKYKPNSLWLVLTLINALNRICFLLVGLRKRRFFQIREECRKIYVSIVVQFYQIFFSFVSNSLSCY